MAGISVTLDDAEIRRAIGNLLARVRNLHPVMDKIGQVLVTDADLTFRAQADPWGTPWEELSETTLARRRGSSAQILRDTGRLANSLHYRADEASVTVGTDVLYARVHQFGNPENRFFGRALAPIPARPFLPIRDGRVDLPNDTRATILDILARYLQEGRA